MQCFLGIILLFTFCESHDFSLKNCVLSSKDLSINFDLRELRVPNDDWSIVRLDDDPSVSTDLSFGFCKNKCHGSYICLRPNNDDPIIDIGSTIKDIDYDSDGGSLTIELKGTHGSGSVQIVCTHPESSLDPLPVIRRNENSQFTFDLIWRSSLACSTKLYKSVDSCILYTEKFSYDLRPLQKTDGYRIVEHGREFIINFCTEVNLHPCPPHVSLCELIGGEGKGIAYRKGSTLTRLPEQLLLSFDNFDGGTTDIILYCSDETMFQSPAIKFVRESGKNLEFSITTPIACSAQRMNCTIENHDIYDLSGLNKVVDNWEMELLDGKLILFNVCETLNYKEGIMSSGGSYWATVISNNETLGVATSHNVSVVDFGILNIQYVGKCGSGIFKLDITLICDTAEGLPNNVTLRGDCAYEIVWYTQYACPVKYDKGADCKVKNLYSDFNDRIIDFSPLRNIYDDYTVISSDTGSFKINICGNLVTNCSEKTSSVCYRDKSGNEHSVGEVTINTPKFVDGQYIFTYEGETCNGNTKRSRVHVSMICDLEVKQSQPEFSKMNECDFYFIWRTDIVCGEAQHLKFPCIYNDLRSGKVYNLTQLQSLTKNYQIPYNDSHFLINVCHSVIPGHRVHCPYNSGACICRSTRNPKKYGGINLGIVSKTDRLKFTNGKVRVEYNSGSICSEKAKSLSTVIDFECDEKSNNTGIIKFERVQDCTYFFTWITSHACPLDVPTIGNLKNNSEGMRTDACFVKDPQTKTVLHLKSLMGKNHLVVGTNLIIGVCGPVNHSTCPHDSGSCSVGSNVSISYGLYNSEVRYENNSIYLTYTGEDCRVTHINFICSSKETGPVLVKENKDSGKICKKIIEWRTQLVCLEEVERKCCMGLRNLCDIFPETYETKIGPKLVRLAICRPIMPLYGIHCPGGPSACIVDSIAQNGEYFNETNLGFSFHSENIINKDESIMLTYFQGSSCLRYPHLNYSTSIRFFCSPNSKNGNPKFISLTGGCQYNFAWGTSHLCRKEPTIYHNCSSSENNGSLILSHFNDYETEVNVGNGMKYLLSLCSVSTKCGSHLCRMNENTGWEDFAVLSNTESDLSKANSTILHYDSLFNLTCGAEVLLECDIHSGHGRPHLLKETDCFLNIEWKSELACVSLQTDIVPPSYTAWIAGSVVLFVIVFLILIILYIYKSKNAASTSCIRRAVTYSKFSFSEEECDDSDDECIL